MEYLHDRIDLDLKRRVTIYLTPEQVSTFVPPINRIIKIVIRGSAADVKSIMKLRKIRELQKEGIKVSSKYIDENSQTDANDPLFDKQMRYLERLHLEIKDDQDQVKCFETIFGKINIVE